MCSDSVSTKNAIELRDLLERVYRRYNRRACIESDPLQYAYRFSDARDIEIAAFLAAALAYGRVQQIHRSLERLFALTGPSPYEFTAAFAPSSRKKLAGFKHRFTTGQDIADLLELLSGVLGRHGSLQSFFLGGYDARDETVLPALTRFCDVLGAAYADAHGGHLSRGLMYLLANPRRGSVSKRLHLFLRWMVRDDDVDPGLWTGIDKARLIVPVDVHMGRLCHILGLHDGRTISLAGAVKITAAFAKIEPADPVKYDFALSRIGILENCNGRRRIECDACELFGICVQKENWIKRIQRIWKGIPRRLRSPIWRSSSFPS